MDYQTDGWGIRQTDRLSNVCRIDELSDGWSVQYNEDGLRRNIHTIFDDTNGNGNSSVCITASDRELREKT